MKKFRSKNIGDEVVVKEGITSGLSGAKSELEAYFNSLEQASAAIVKFSNNNTEMTYTVKSSDDMFETHIVSIDKYGNMIDKLTQS
jgi:hypothetical protein